MKITDLWYDENTSHIDTTGTKVGPHTLLRCFKLTKMFNKAFSGVKANYLVSYVSIEVGVRYEGDRVRFSGPDWPEFRDLSQDENIHGFIWVVS